MLKKYSIILTVLGFVILALLVWFFSSIVLYVLISFVLSIIGHPLVNLLCKIKIRKLSFPRGMSAIITLLVMMGVVVGFILFFVPIISMEAKIISQIDMQGVTAYFNEPLEKLQAFLIRCDIIDTNQTIKSVLETQFKSFAGMISFTDILKNLAGTTGSLFFGIFSIMFLTFFFLKNEKMFPNFILLLIPKKYEEETKNIISKIHYLLTRYFIGLLGELVSMMTLITVGLTIFGIQNAIIIGFLGGLMNIIPYLGPLIGGSIGVFIGVTTALSYGLYDKVLDHILEIIGVFVTANLIDNVLLQPLIYSSSVKAQPVEIFLVIIMAGSLAGIPGMILAIPAYTVLRVIAKEFLSNMRIVQKLTKDI